MKSIRQSGDTMAISGSTWRLLVFAIGCMLWVIGGWWITITAGPNYFYFWDDSLSESTWGPISGLVCPGSDESDGRVTARISNGANIAFPYRVVFDYATVDPDGQSHTARLCDTVIDLEPGEASIAGCDIPPTDRNTIGHVRVVAWNSKIYPICDRGCGSSQGNCHIIPDIRTRMAWPDVWIALGTILVTGFAVAALGVAVWRRVKPSGRVFMIVCALVSVWLAGESANMALDDSSLGYAIALVPLAAAASVVVWGRLRVNRKSF